MHFERVRHDDGDKKSQSNSRQSQICNGSATGSESAGYEAMAKESIPNSGTTASRLTLQK